ncbi:hypothetical protein GCM10009819_32140 [Agromyces tropicus]|uniref:Uncharacterized protein n=1 Tax=Agromyces tropicus TaxID=555371 RepID=A0ABP5GEC2_9MICO
MIVVSLTLNIIVLVPVLTALQLGGRRVDGVFGERSPAREILRSVYAAILLASATLLIAVLLDVEPRLVEGAVLGLLAIQVVYKVGTAVTVRHAFRNPVVLSNLGIAAVHGATIVTVLVGA